MKGCSCSSHTTERNVHPPTERFFQSLRIRPHDLSYEILFTIFDKNTIYYCIRQYKSSYLVMAQSDLFRILKGSIRIEILESLMHKERFSCIIFRDCCHFIYVCTECAIGNSYDEYAILSEITTGANISCNIIIIIPENVL
jgi:hypothetical protein